MATADDHLEFDRSTRRLFRIRANEAVENVHLTPLEQRLVEYMFTANRHKGGAPAICTYRELTRAVWPDREHEDARSFLNGLVLDLRRKIETDASAPRFLTTTSGEGYGLAVRPFAAVRAPSPFIVGLPVTEPARFFGRVREVSLLFKLWTHRPLHSAIVAGPRRSGKTSLLHYLKALPQTSPADLRPGQVPSPLPPAAGVDGAVIPRAYRIAFINFQDPRMQRLDHILGQILHAFELREALPCQTDAFVDCISSELDSPAIILMDEVDKALHRPELRDLWGTLRSAACDHPLQLLGMVLACHAIPQGGCDATDESPLMNILGEYVELGPFSRHEAEELIATSPLPFPREDVDWILQQSGCWPALVQMFCDTRLKDLEARGQSSDWRQHALKRGSRLRHLVPG